MNLSYSDVEALLRRCRSWEPTYWQKRAQKIDWAVGQVLCMKNGATLDEWMLRLTVAKSLENK